MVIEKSKLDGAAFVSHLKSMRYVKGCNFRVTVMKDKAFQFHGPANLGEAGGHRFKVAGAVG